MGDREEVGRLLGELQGSEATVVRMYHLEGKTYQEISRTVGMPENSVGPMLSRARETTPPRWSRRRHAITFAFCFVLQLNSQEFGSSREPNSCEFSCRNTACITGFTVKFSKCRASGSKATGICLIRRTAAGRINLLAECLHPHRF